MLLILSGLPGTGKTTIARELARRLRAAHIRIDSIEQAIGNSGVVTNWIDDAGYRAGYAVAEDNLRLGLTVIADSVNPLHLTRAAWRAVATRADRPSVEVEIVCADLAEHRRRVEARVPDLPGHTLPTWQEVVGREYQPWDSKPIRIEPQESRSTRPSPYFLHTWSARVPHLKRSNRHEESGFRGSHPCRDRRVLFLQGRHRHAGAGRDDPALQPW